MEIQKILVFLIVILVSVPGWSQEGAFFPELETTSSFMENDPPPPTRPPPPPPPPPEK